jgi:hypothetical protein
MPGIAWVVAGVAWATSPLDWEGSRWLVEIEETTPTPLELSADDSVSFRTRALQLQVVLSCTDAKPFGKRRAEVDCRPEAVALRATPRRLTPGEAANPGNQQVLDDLVARLSSGVVRLTVTRDGRVPSVDLPELEARTRRDSESREVLRRLMFDLVSGFSLERPEDWATAEAWRERSSALLRAPTEPATLGMSKIDHVVAEVDGETVIQSRGAGTFTAPYVPWEYSYEGGFAQPSGGRDQRVDREPPALGGDSASDLVSGVSGGSLEAVGEALSPGASSSASPGVDRTFSGEFTSVAVMDGATGLPRERVWATIGRTTASSVGNMQTFSLYYSGKVRRLDPDEVVVLGPTEVVAPPGRQLDGVGEWVPLALAGLP